MPRPQGRVARSSGRGPGEDPAADGRGRCGAARPGPLRAEGAAAAFPTPQLTAPARQGELTQLLSSSMTRLSPSCTASITTRPGVCPPLAQQERAWPCLGRRANYQSLLSPGWEWGGGHFLECIQLASVAKECMSPAFVSYNSSDTPGGLGIGTWLPLFVRRDPICPREPWEHLEDEGEATRHME